LTPEEQRYASENFALVDTYLKRKHLDENEFFDVVVFGYLRAVRQYLAKPELLKYRFSTIAFRKMNDCLYAYYRYLSRPRRNACVVSLDAPIGSEGGLSLHDIVAGPDPEMLDFETEQLFLEMASKLSRRQLHVVRMKAKGCGIREIARRQGVKTSEIKTIMDKANGVIVSVCGG